MPLPSFLQRFRRDAARSASVSDATPLSSSDVEATRVRARRRLIGMVVLVGAGVIGFPVLFETQPRPMSGDVKIVQAPGAGANGGEPASEAAPLPERGASGKVAVAGIVEPPAQEPALAAKPSPEPVPSEEIDSTPPVVPVPKALVAEGHAKVSKPESASKPVPKEAAKDASKDKSKDADKEAAAKAAKEKAAKDKQAKDKEQAKSATKDSAKTNDKGSGDKGNGTRYVVQFGAFSDVPTAHEARMKVERLGLRTYTQQVDTPAGKRIRVRMGPYADKAEADKAMATLRKAGLTGAVLTL